MDLNSTELWLVESQTNCRFAIVSVYKLPIIICIVISSELHNRTKDLVNCLMDSINNPFIIAIP